MSDEITTEQRAAAFVHCVLHHAVTDGYRARMTANLIREAEERGRVEMRERCAQVAEDCYNMAKIGVIVSGEYAATTIAEEIRALLTSPAPAHSSSEGQETATATVEIMTVEEAVQRDFEEAKRLGFGYSAFINRVIGALYHTMEQEKQQAVAEHNEQCIGALSGLRGQSRNSDYCQGFVDALSKARGAIGGLTKPNADASLPSPDTDAETQQKDLLP